MKAASLNLLGAFVDSVYKFSDMQALLEVQILNTQLKQQQPPSLAPQLTHGMKGMGCYMQLISTKTKMESGGSHTKTGMCIRNFPDGERKEQSILHSCCRWSASWNTSSLCSQYASRTGELVTMGVDVRQPHYVIGVISADGKNLLHKINLKYESRKLIHEIGVTENYNVIMDYPLRFGIDKVLVGQQFIQHDTNARARIGVMPRFGDAESTSWFDVKNHCSYHLINSFEEGHEVVVRGCRILWSVIPGPDHKTDKAKWYQRAFLQPKKDSKEFDPSIDGILFSRPYEWRLDLVTGEVVEGYLTCEEVAMDFPAINNSFIGIRNKYAYSQVVDSLATSNSIAGLTKYKMLAKLHLDTKNKDDKELIKADYHVPEENHFCSGVQFVEKKGAVDEDDGWLISYVHDERANVSKVYIIDAKRFTEEPVAKITLPQRVPYGFHDIFISK